MQKTDLTYLYPDEPIEPHDKISYDLGHKVDLSVWFLSVWFVSALHQVKLYYNNADVMPGQEEDRAFTIRVAASTNGSCALIEDKLNNLCKFVEVYGQHLVLSRLTYASLSRMSNTVWLEFSVTTNPEKYALRRYPVYHLQVTI